MELDSNSHSTKIWDYKPWWCQPWSIVLTGILATIGSWLILHIYWLTISMFLLIVAWWLYFLIIYPKAFANYMESQQSIVNNDHTKQ